MNSARSTKPTLQGTIPQTKSTHSTNFTTRSVGKITVKLKTNTGNTSSQHTSYSTPTNNTKNTCCNKYSHLGSLHKPHRCYWHFVFVCPRRRSRHVVPLLRCPLCGRLSATSILLARLRRAGEYQTKEPALRAGSNTFQASYGLEAEPSSLLGLLCSAHSTCYLYTSFHV